MRCPVRQVPLCPRGLPEDEADADAQRPPEFSRLMVGGQDGTEVNAWTEVHISTEMCLKSGAHAQVASPMGQPIYYPACWEERLGPREANPATQKRV